jgi:hypothetical protein
VPPVAVAERLNAPAVTTFVPGDPKVIAFDAALTVIVIDLVMPDK